MPHVLAVVGAQYGSEGKGAIVSKIASEYGVHVRVGGPNAGHTIYHHDRKWVMQVLPCGWINPHATLVIGRGMLLDVERLGIELADIETVDPTIRSRVRIDSKAGVLAPHFHKQEGGVHGELHARIGSTGEGVGAARIARIERDVERFNLVGDLPGDHWISGMVVDNTPELMRNLMIAGNDIILEGTQGSGLSLIHGAWPYVTSADTNAAQMAADAGLPPNIVRTLLVARTMPIRVAGTSGPLEFETSWGELSRKLGRYTEETTTVTKKVRRIGYWEKDVVRQAAVLNNPDAIALTFMDYIDEEVREQFIIDVQRETQVPVIFTSTGGRPEDVYMRTPLEVNESMYKSVAIPLTNVDGVLTEEQNEYSRH